MAMPRTHSALGIVGTADALRPFAQVPLTLTPYKTSSKNQPLLLQSTHGAHATPPNRRYTVHIQWLALVSISCSLSHGRRSVPAAGALFFFVCGDHRWINEGGKLQSEVRRSTLSSHNHRCWNVQSMGLASFLTKPYCLHESADEEAVNVLVPPSVLPLRSIIETVTTLLPTWPYPSVLNRPLRASST